MIFIQWYSIALILADVYELYTLHTAPEVSLSEATVWFDLFSDSTVSVLLYTAVLLLFMVSRGFVVLQPVNRWMIMLNLYSEAIRVLLFAYLFKVNRAASSWNTFLLTFMVCNVVLYARNYYTTKLYLEGNLGD
ncbi:hypothetical protein AGDE_00812 [Angomonas deanei]|uniref:Uncharacterized protein n=1 Tax=Angomonas deanei TaxID=59799 RepID=S9VEU1_9TRYP|nr:hypothetical protein AGDE_04369 [Angomonas deanei]EPY43111.1 hypothetical protein AGDE_00812 [Angomonas deanei]CAD2214442.1 hypothetical protein, conserved [Angomonas deanei]|eukprot:EPY39559.1 hypothetical protein AGDE_04369 [Angomonas deanei]